MFSVRVQPAKPRARVEEDSEELRIILPAPRHLFHLIFMTVWSIGWVIGEVAALSKLLFNFPPPLPLDQRGFLLLWLLFWTFGGGYMILCWLWMAFGKEVITLRDKTLLLRKQIFGQGVTHEFILNDVCFLRVSSEERPPQGWATIFGAQPRQQMKSPFTNEGPFAFDYYGKTYRFGAGIEKAEALGLLDRINLRLRNR